LSTQPEGEQPRTGPTRAQAGFAGFLAVLAGLGVSELVAALLPQVRSLVVAVGDLVIDEVPGWVERAVIQTLGTADKPFLVLMILLVSMGIGIWLGVLAARRFFLGAAGLVTLAALGAGAALLDPQADPLPALAAGTAYAVAAVGSLAALLWGARSDLKPRVAKAPRTAETVAGQATGPDNVPMGPSVTRRRFIGVASVVAVLAATSGTIARTLVNQERVNRIREALRLPRPRRPAPAPPAGADLGISGVTPLYMPNPFFYRIDTALMAPQVDPTSWSLEVKGRVDRPFEISYDELLSMPHIEADITLVCVSNYVGGDLVGNARWQGVPLHVLLERAGLQREATQVVGRSVDDFTAGFPTRWAFDQRDAMVAVAMNGEPLPIIHGFPARLVVPGLYGYVSATKWLESIELRSWDEFEGYWVPRGWAKEAPVKTQSRIDVPGDEATVEAGRGRIAGVAWAPTRGIDRVEIRVDDEPWREARLAAAIDADTWRQWVFPWDATAGRHEIAVRATDGTGETQTAERSALQPDGSTGHHTISVTVR